VDWTNISEQEWRAIFLSLKVASVATLASLPIAIGVALLLARGSFAGKWLLNAMIYLPLVLPPVVTGYVLLILFGRKGVIGAFLESHLDIVLSFRWTGAALACAVMAFPLMVRAIKLSIEAVDYKLEEAANTLGANRIFTFATITLPLALPGIIAGAIIGFAKAIGEFGATITFVSNIPGETQTLSAAIYSYTQVPGGDLGAMRLTIVAVIIAVAAVLISEYFAARVIRRSGAKS
jgi:molybdate transport system permease protein